MTRALSVAAMRIYPVKGVRGVSLDEVVAEPRGLARDRRWLIVDGENNFITQRENGRLAMIRAEITDRGLQLSADGAGAIDVAAPDGAARKSASVWRDQVDVAIADDGADWLSEFLGEPCRLAFMDDAARRATPEKWGAAAPVSFADSFPFLFATTASLRALNETIAADGGAPVGMERFRPNIVIDTDEPWAEDHWARLDVGGTAFDLVKPCDRCVVTTRDQMTGEATGKEPLKSLAKLRRSADERVSGVLFGWNARLSGEGGVIRVGDPVEIIERREEGWPLAVD